MHPFAGTESKLERRLERSLRGQDAEAEDAFRKGHQGALDSVALLGRLDDPLLRHIAALKLEGCAPSEIADRVGGVPRTVQRKLLLIRQFWQQASEPN